MTDKPESETTAGLLVGEVLPVAGYRINTGHGNHLTEVLDEARKSFMWAGKPAWRELTYRDSAQATIAVQAAEIERLKRERDEAREFERQVCEQSAAMSGELESLKAKQVADIDEVMRLADSYAQDMSRAVGISGTQKFMAAREALRSAMAASTPQGQEKTR